MTENQISRIIYEASIEVHKVLGGPGLLESIYEDALAHEISLMGLMVERQIQVPVFYKGVQIKQPLRLDLLVERKVIIEVKATELYHPIFAIQTLTYLRLSKLKLGMVVNFGQALMKNGIKRVVNGL